MDGVGDLRAVDSHFHIWSPATHTWLHKAAKAEPKPGFLNFAPVAEVYTNEQHLADLQGSGLKVDKGVFVQANFDGDPREEVEFVTSHAEASPSGMPQAVVAYSDLPRPDLARAQLDKVSKHPRFRGVRYMLDWDEARPGLRQSPRDGIMSEPGFLEGMALLERIPGAVFDLQVTQCQLREAAQLVRRFPSVTFSLNHAGFPLGGGRDAGLLAEWREGLHAVAGAPNSVCKISALCNYDAALGLSEWTPDPGAKTGVQGYGGWTPDAVALLTRCCLEAFSPERCMWGSNLPVDNLVGNPAARTRAFVASLAHLRDEERDLVLHGTAERVYRI